MSIATSCLIDLNRDPFIPPGWRIQSHRRRGIFDWGQNGSKIIIHQFPNQIDDRTVSGTDLQIQLGQFLLFNANLLDFFLAHKSLIPHNWRGEKYILFWDTVFLNHRSEPCVRSLYWGLELDWVSHHRILDSRFGRFDYAVMQIP